MNIQRFTAPTSREAMAKARQAFGDSAVILSSRATDGGFEVMAAAEESLAPVAQPGSLASRAEERMPVIRTRRADPPAFRDSVQDDTEQMAMSTLSFQEYVRERMLRKRRAAMEGEGAENSAPAAREAAAPRAPAARVQAPTERPAPVRLAMPPAPMATPEPAPIRTRAAAPAPVWSDSEALAPRAASAASASEGRMAVELSALKDMIEERFNTLAWLGSSKQNPIQSTMMLKLIRAGYSPAIARAVLERMPADTGASQAVRWVMDTLTRNLRTATPGSGLCDEGGVVALIGATGVGKTTTAAKLAAQCVRQHGAASVGLITLDTYRVSGYEQLRAYGRMLGVVAHLAHDRAALKDLLDLLSSKRMVIIDTAGLGQRDQRIQEMLDVLDMPSVKKVLVLNAGSHGDTLDDVLTSFKSSGLHGVVLSKVDEAVKLGPAIDALVRHQVVLRGVANGQRVPEDWQNPDAATLVRVAMGTEGKSAYDPVATDMGFYFSQASSRGIQLGAGHV
ncbi:flagellar biosynthesis protein FlhF [Hydrogenophaga luteola]|uniref:Flagellar biosynthesis protein FlhF n=1 Tax=Hydrogenophaga luteola TaxID=1591122 RepID=A0ABV7W9K1_9BURK